MAILTQKVLSTLIITLYTRYFCIGDTYRRYVFRETSQPLLEYYCNQVLTAK